MPHTVTDMWYEFECIIITSWQTKCDGGTCGQVSSRDRRSFFIGHLSNTAFAVIPYSAPSPNGQRSYHMINPRREPCTNSAFGSELPQTRTKTTMIRACGEDRTDRTSKWQKSPQIPPGTHRLPGAPEADHLSNKFCYRPQDVYIVELMSLSWAYPLILASPRWNLWLIHDAPRKRASPGCWYGLLGTCRRIIRLRIHLWCVLLVRGMSLIHNFDTRSVPCNLLCFGRYFCVRFLLLKNCLFSRFLKLDRRKGFYNRATAAMFAATVINFLLFSLKTGGLVAKSIVYIRVALVLDIDYPLSGESDLVDQALKQMDIVSYWSSYLPVSIKLSPSDLISIRARCRYFSAIPLSFGGLGLFPDRPWVVLIPFILWIGVMGE